MMKNISQEWFNFIAGSILVLIIYLLLCGFSAFNKSYSTITDTNVHVIDKYHETEDCTWISDGNGGSYETCDPERFVVMFDNHASFDLKNREPWSQVRENQLWHWHKEDGRLWTIKEEAYPL